MNDDRITPATASARLADAAGARYVTLFNKGRVELEYYQPLENDPQQPHTRDEIYFVIAGSGWFVRSGQRQRFGPGEVLHVPAGQPHRFEDFSDDFATWAIFVDPR